MGTLMNVEDHVLRSFGEEISCIYLIVKWGILPPSGHERLTAHHKLGFKEAFIELPSSEREKNHSFGLTEDKSGENRTQVPCCQVCQLSIL